MAPAISHFAATGSAAGRSETVAAPVAPSETLPWSFSNDVNSSVNNDINGGGNNLNRYFTDDGDSIAAMTIAGGI